MFRIGSSRGHLSQEKAAPAESLGQRRGTSQALKVTIDNFGALVPGAGEGSMSTSFLRGLVSVCAIVSAGAVAAQPLPDDTIDPARMLPHFDSQNIDATLKTVTGNQLAEIAKDGSTIVRAYSPGGLEFTIHFHQCEGENQTQCGAIQLLTSWEVGEDGAALDQLIARSAPNYLFVNLGRLRQGRPYMLRIVLAGQGISQANLAQEVRLFLEYATQFNAQLRASPE